MKLPAIVQQPVGEFAKGNIPVPRKDKLGEAVGNLGKSLGALYGTIRNEKLVSEVDEAQGKAATELSELKAILVNENTVDADWVGDDALGEIQVSRTVQGERETDTSPKMFTHQIADDVWAKRSQEIIAHYAETIDNPKAQTKFIGEMNERYVAPGTGQIASANIIRSRAYSQAQAETAIQGVLASSAPTETRESQAKEIIARQVLLGADPVWAQKRIEELGPNIDQMDVHNAVLAAGTADELDLIEEDMWAGGSRMGPEQMRVMSSQMDARRRDFLAEDKMRQDGNADQMFMDYHNPDVPVGTMDVAAAVANSAITREAGWTFINSMNSGGAAPKASDQFTLSHYRSEIQRLQFVGNNMRISDKARVLKLAITRGSMGLTPQGVSTGMPANISGVDALTLSKEIDTAVKAATENQPYKDALGSLLLWTRSDLNLEGQIVTGLGGNQNQVEAAVAFKVALDNYMESYGIDARPGEFFDKNKDAYDPRNFTNGIDARFLDKVPEAEPYMERNNQEVSFPVNRQQDFALWLSNAPISETKIREYNQLFNQFYEGQGVPPNNGALMLEPDDPLYRQFQMGIPDVE